MSLRWNLQVPRTKVVGWRLDVEDHHSDGSICQKPGDMFAEAVAPASDDHEFPTPIPRMGFPVVERLPVQGAVQDSYKPNVG